MRVLVIAHRFPPEGIMGVERYAQALVRQLSAAGDEVTVVAAGSDDDAREPYSETEHLSGGGRLHRLLAPRACSERFLVRHQGFERLFEPILAEADPEVVHVNHLLHVSPRFVHDAGRSPAAIVVSVHDYYFECALYQLRTSAGELCCGPDGGRACANACFAAEGRAAESRWAARTAYFRRLLDVAERVHAPSAHVASRLGHQLADLRRLRTIPLGVYREPVASRPEAPLTDRFRVAFAGKVVPPKGVHVLVEGLALARLSEVELVLLGPIPEAAYAAALRAHAERIPGLRLELHGEFEPSELPRLLAGSDCLVVPSEWPETYSFVTREALALGVPAVVSRLGALPEIVQDGVNGFTFGHDQPGELARILRRLSEDPKLRRRLAEGAEATPRTGPAEHARAMRSLYAEAVEDRRQGRAELIAELDVLFAQLVELGFADQPSVA